MSGELVITRPERDDVGGWMLAHGKGVGWIEDWVEPYLHDGDAAVVKAFAARLADALATHDGDGPVVATCRGWAPCMGRGKPRPHDQYELDALLGYVLRNDYGIEVVVAGRCCYRLRRSA